MTDRVHPKESPPSAQDTTATANQPPQQEAPLPVKPRPPPGTYVVQIPKDQIYRYPPPENSRRYQKYAHQKNRKNCSCCRCLCWTLAVIALLLLLIAIAAGVLYLVFRPKAPKYSVQKLSIRGFNLTSSTTKGSIFSPEIDVTVRADNPNDKIGVYYRKGSSVAVSYSDVDLCDGVLPAFYQPSNNVTVFRTALVGSGIRFSRGVYEGLIEQQRRGEIPLGLDLKVPVRIKMGSLKTWTITVKVHCDIRVNKLSNDSSIISNKCDVDVLPWKRT